VDIEFAPAAAESDLLFGRQVLFGEENDEVVKESLSYLGHRGVREAGGEVYAFDLGAQRACVFGDF
jgi:hypothetical protein